jgi:hypothetical protein
LQDSGMLSTAFLVTVPFELTILVKNMTV